MIHSDISKILPPYYDSLSILFLPRVFAIQISCFCDSIYDQTLEYIDLVPVEMNQTQIPLPYDRIQPPIVGILFLLIGLI